VYNSLPSRKQNRTGKFILGVLLLVATVVGIVIWSFQSNPSSGGSPTTGSVKEKSSTGKPAIPFTGFTLQPGDRISYDFTSQGALTMGPSDSASPATALQIHESGRLNIHIYTTTSVGWLAGFAWENVKLNLYDGQSEQDKTPADLAGPEIMAVMDKSGRIGQVRVPLSLSDEARNNWRDVLAHWQVILPQNTFNLKWTRVEDDATGSYVAQYSAKSALTPLSIDKNKLRYLRVNADNPALVATYHITSSAKISFDGYQRSIHGTEKVEVGGVNDLPRASTAGEYAFVLANFSKGGATAPPDTSKYTLMAWAIEFGPESAPPEEDGDFAANVQDLVNTIAAGAFGTPEQVRTAGKIIDQIKKDPALTDQLLDELRGDNVPKKLGSAILGILGAAGTPAAQYDLLAVAASSDWPSDFRQMALFSYVQTDNPMPEADNALKALFEQGGDFSSSALLVFAAIGDKVRTSDPTRFQQINDYISVVANAPNLSLNDLVVVLDAIGNLGPLQVPDVVTKAIQNENDLVRAAAIASLTRINTPAAFTLVNNAINNDPSSNVQVAGIKALVGLEKTAAVSDLATIAANGKSVPAREEALTLISNFTKISPIVSMTISTAAQSDPAPEVRDYATKLLSTLPGNMPASITTPTP